uniref:Uncharacterized protein n=1 Tax=Rhodnius prolixus TaxID=13249 RepID=T1H7Q3_RHOPR
MYTQVSIAVLLLVGCSLAYPRTYQEQRQTFYTQPIPVHQRLAAAPQLYYQQQPILQVPAATSLLPNNVNSGVRYGQQQVLYVVPSGSQVYYEEGAEGEESGGSLYNLFNGLVSYFPFQSGEKPAEGGGAEGEAKPEKTEEKPEKLEQSAGSENLIGASEQLQQGIQAQQVLHPQPLQFQAQKQQHQQLLQQQQQQQQQALEKYLALRNQFVANTPALGLPSPNLLYYKNVAQLADYNTKPGAAAIAFQRHLSKKGHENHVQTTTEKEENENEESGTDGESTNEELEHS